MRPHEHTADRPMLACPAICSTKEVVQFSSKGISAYLPAAWRYRCFFTVTQCHADAMQAAYGFRFLLGLTLAGIWVNREGFTGLPDSGLAATPTTRFQQSQRMPWHAVWLFTCRHACPLMCLAVELSRRQTA